MADPIVVRDEASTVIELLHSTLDIVFESGLLRCPSCGVVLPGDMADQLRAFVTHEEPGARHGDVPRLT